MIGDTALGLSLYEISEHAPVETIDTQYVRLDTLSPKTRRSPYADDWVHREDMPTGRMCLQVYSPYHGVDWVQRWIETRPGDLSDQVSSILKSLTCQALILAAKIATEQERAAQARKKWQEDWEEGRRRECEQRRLKVLQDSRDQLDGVILTWAKVNSINAFFKELAQSASSLEPARHRLLLEKLAKAKALIGDLDAITHFEHWEPPSEP